MFLSFRALYFFDSAVEPNVVDRVKDAEDIILVEG